jgi:hypothetical protein
MVNFYENKKLRELLTTYDNPCFDIHRISIPFRMGIISASGGGKTCMVLNMIHKMPFVFEWHFLFTFGFDDYFYFIK